MIKFVAASWHAGENPAWSPYHYAGFPMIADPQSTLWTPTFWVPSLMSAAPTMYLVDIVHLAHLLAGALAILAFGIGRGWRIEAALIAAITYMMGGAATLRLEHLLMTVSYMWLAIAFWRLDTLIQKGRLWRGIAFAAPLGLMLVDRNHVAYLGAWFLFLYWLTRLIPDLIVRRKRYVLKQHWPVVFGGLMAIAMLAVPFLLLIQLADHSNRPNFGLEEASWQSVHVVALISLLMPEYLGSLRQAGDYWGPASFSWGGENLLMHRGMLHFYMGALPVLLIVWHGLAHGRLFQKGVRFFTVSAVFLLVYALGRYTPLFALLYEGVPGVDLFRRPADGMFLLGFAISLLTGALLHRAISEPTPPLRWPAIVIIVLTTLAIAVPIGLLTIERDKVDYLIRGSAVFAVAMLVFVVILLLIKNTPARKPLLLAALLVFATTDLLYHTSGISANARPPDAYQALETPQDNAVFSKLLPRLSAQDPTGAPWRVETLGLGPTVQNIGQAAGIANVLGYNPIRLGSFARHIGPGMQNNAGNRRTFGDKMTGYGSAMANELGIRYIVTGKPIETIDPTLEPGQLTLLETAQWGQKTAFLYENPNAEPRAMLIDANGNRVDGAVKIVSYGQTAIHVTVTTEEPATLVLREFHYPGWHVDVDEVPMELQKVDDLFRAVSLPAGEHRVRFWFNLLMADNLNAVLDGLLPASFTDGAGAQ
ncbi:MAG: hypothetical protein AAFW47_05885 [Pseudomonadota bacterium]